MIPRRKIYIEKADFLEWLKSPFSDKVSDHLDVKKFEKAFGSFLNSRYALVTASGRDAIMLALHSLEIRQNDEIILPAYTLGELVPLLRRNGFVPVPVDVEEDSFNLDIRDLEKKLTKKTKVILATHLLGAPCDITTICDMARSHNIFVIEDCAHSPGAKVGEKYVGTFGDLGIFSLQVNKPVSSYGGGMIVTDDDGLADKISKALLGRHSGRVAPLEKALSCWGEELLVRSPMYPVIARLLFSDMFSAAFERFYRGAHDKQRNESMYSAFQARVGLSRLARLTERNKTLNIRWDELARRFPKTFKIQNRRKIGSPAFYNFVALSPSPPKRVRKMAAHLGIDIGIGSEVMDDCSQMAGKTCPVAQSIFQRALLVPLYENLSDGEFERIVSGFKKISDSFSV